MELKTSDQILRAIMSAAHFDMEGVIYEIRDRELKGWDGPAVTEWSNICVAAKKWFKEDGEK